MVKLTLNYDATLHQKTFILKGEEAYARTTDTTLVLNKFLNSTDSIEYVRVGVEIDVLREVGEDSTVVLYDNGVKLDDNVYTWSAGQSKIVDGTSSDTNGLHLAYGVEHNLYAVYMGNNQCLKSKSQTIQYTEPIPPSAETQITLSANANNNHGSSVVVSATLGYVGTGYTASLLNHQTFKWYVDDEYKGESQAGSSSPTATYTFTGLDDGIHIVKAVFEGSDYLYGCDKSLEISVGYDVEVVDYSAMMVNGYSDNFVTAKVTDMYGEPVSSATVTLTDTSSTTGTTDSNGVVTFKSSNGFTNFTVSYGGFTTEAITVPKITVSSLAFDRDELDVMQGKTGSFEVSIKDYSWDSEGSNKAGIPITLTGGLTGTYYTDNNGVVNIGYTDSTSSNITASVSSVTKTLTVNRVLQYWIANTPSSNWNKNADTQSVFLNYVRNGFQMIPHNDNATGRLVIYGVPLTSTFSCSFEVVDIGDSGRITVAGITTDVAIRDKVKVIFDSSNNSRTLKVNNKIVGSSSSSSMLDIKINEGLNGAPRGDGIVNYLTFNNLKVQYEVL